jgi:rhodanese-related sulfurtransferase
MEGTQMPAPDAISCEQLARLIGTPRAPVVLDVRREAVRTADPRILPGARTLSEVDLAPQALARLAADLAGPVVVVCAEGHRLSQGSAAWLRHEGVQAEYLLGGQAAWVATGLPLINPARITARDAQGRSIWVTRSRPKIDRIACPWLIRRFIDPRAVFLFVAPAEVQGVAERFGAMPYDIEGVFWSHRDELCTFDVLLSEFGLSTPALDRLALIVRGADTARPDLAPECAGLLAASLGLSRMYSDDLAQLEAGIALYDAFYRWARDATEETHNWPATGVKAK